jgi:hypothetical protein
MIDKCLSSYRSQGLQGPTGVIKPGFYTGLNADQVDGRHVSKIIKAETIFGGGRSNGRFHFQESWQRRKQSIFCAVQCC